MARRTRAPDARRSGLLQSASAGARLDAAGEWLLALDAAEPALAVVPSALAGARLCQPLLRPGGARFGLQRLTLRDLALELAIGPLARRGLAPADAGAERALVARAIAELDRGLADSRDRSSALGRFARVRERPGLPGALHRTLQELSLADIGAAKLEAVDPDLARVERAYRHELAQAGLVDRGGLLALALEALEGGHPLAQRPCLWLDVPVHHTREARLARALLSAAPHALCTVPSGDTRTLQLLGTVLPRVSGQDAQTLWDDALRRLQSHLFEAAAPRGTLGGAVMVLSAPGEGRECVEVARRLLLEAQGGTPFDRMAVVMRSTAGYSHQLAEALARAGIPAHFTDGSTRPHVAGRALLSLLECKREGLSARAFAEYLSLSVAPVPIGQDDPDRAAAANAHAHARIGASADVAHDARDTRGGRDGHDGHEPEGVGLLSRASARRWERLLEDAAVIGGVGRWQAQLDALAHKLDAEAAELERAGGDTRGLEADRVELRQLRALSLPLMTMLDGMPPSAPWSDWLQALRSLAHAALAEPDTVLGALEQLTPLGALGPVGLDEVLRVLGPLLRELREPPRGDGAGKVLCGSIDRVRGMHFELVCVLGLAEKIFPQKVSEDPVLLDEVRGLLDASLERNAERIAHERLALRTAVGAARRRVILSYPRIDLERGRPRVPSFYGLEVLRAAEGELPGFDALMRRAEDAAAARIGWPAPTQPELAIDEAEHDLSLLHDILRKSSSETHGAARYLLRVNPHLARALRFRARRWSVRRFTTADGLVEPSEAALALLQSHRLSARAHSPTVLEAYASCPYRFALRAVHGLRPRTAPSALEVIDPRERGALIHDIQFATLSALQADGLLPLGSAQLLQAREVLRACATSIVERYHARLSPIVARVWDDSVARIERDLENWLASIAEQPLQPSHFELAFGLPGLRERDAQSRREPVTLADGTQLRGSIDMVEMGAPRRAGGSDADERPRARATDHKTGKALQPEGMVIDGGRTLQPLLYALALEKLLPDARVESGRLHYCTAEGGFEQREVVLDERSRGAVMAALETIDDAITRGFLPAAPEQGACEHCDYRVVCGPYEELRVARKDDKALVRLRTLREAP